MAPSSMAEMRARGGSEHVMERHVPKRTIPTARATKTGRKDTQDRGVNARIRTAHVSHVLSAFPKPKRARPSSPSARLEPRTFPFASRHSGPGRKAHVRHAGVARTRTRFGGDGARKDVSVRARHVREKRTRTMRTKGREGKGRRLADVVARTGIAHASVGKAEARTRNAKARVHFGWDWTWNKCAGRGKSWRVRSPPRRAKRTVAPSRPGRRTQARKDPHPHPPKRKRKRKRKEVHPMPFPSKEGAPWQTPK